MPSSKRPDVDPGAKLRKLLSGKKTIATPGVFNPAVALLAEEAGFECLYFSGAAFANSMGLPDLGVTTLSEVAEAAERITTAVPSLPLIVDVDTGFGESVNVARTVREMEKAGAAAIQIEDQVMPKRCGHLDGKEVVEPAEMAKKVIAAKAAAKTELVVIARTDAAETEGLDGAIARARLYQRAGADVIFPEALRSAEEFAEFARKVKGPLLANMTEFGKTPYLSLSDFSRMGEGYKLVIFPVTAFRVAMKAMRDALNELSKSGTQKGLLGKMMTREDFYELTDYGSLEKADKAISQRASRLQDESRAEQPSPFLP
ncbi:MAG TPA: methylisocitrate lyase [Nitrososphaerales archaeon]|nr:methylisocitrate lyase [Nitrososphaerales archaeon]